MGDKNLIIISDSTGETADQIAKAVLVQFDVESTEIIRFSNVESAEKIDDIINKLTGENMIFSTIVNEELMNHLKLIALEKGIKLVDVLEKPLQEAQDFFHQSPLRQIGLTRRLTENYFGKIEALEFAVKYDDGKDPRGIKKADIVLIGVSRTSKTPVSLNLAFKNYHVCNIPLVPEIEAPKELFEISPKKIIGLIIDPEKLNAIRIERMKMMGITEPGEYSDDERIRKELSYAKSLMSKLECTVIDVSDKTIEETTTLISEIIPLPIRENVII